MSSDVFNKLSHTMPPLDKVVIAAIVVLMYTNCGVPKTVMPKTTLITMMAMIVLYLPFKHTSQIRIDDQTDARNRRVMIDSTRNREIHQSNVL